MKTIINLVASMIVLCFISTNLWALESTQIINEDGQVVETFITNSDLHLIAITAGPAALLQPYPSSVQHLYEPNISDGLAALVKLADNEGNIVGFSTELEHITVDPTGKLMAASDWTVKLLGRGTLMVTEIEDHSALVAIVTDMLNNGETERFIDPPVKVQTTVPGTGKIAGGVGEFEDVTGTFREFNEFTYLNIETGMIGVTITLEVTYDKKAKDKDKDKE